MRDPRRVLPKVEARLADLSLAGALRAVDTAIVELDDELLVDADTPNELREIARGL